MPSRSSVWSRERIPGSGTMTDRESAAIREAMLREPSSAADALHIDDGRYAALVAETAAAHSRTDAATLSPSDPAASMLYREARLLDGGRYRDWLTMLAEDCLYWIPTSRNPSDPRRESGVNLDDKRRLLDRIVVIETGLLRAQDPPSRTARIVTNVESWETPSGAIEVRSNLVLWERRRGYLDHYIGWQEHELVPSDEGWLIRRKIINLLNCDEPQGNITFIL